MIVVKFGGHAMKDENGGFAKAIAAAQESGVKIVVVHGGGPQIDAALKEEEIASEFIGGFRVTTSEIFEVVRVFYLLANSIPVVGEINPSTVVSDIYKNSVLGVPYPELVNACIRLVKDDQARDAQARKGLELIKQNPQHVYTNKLL